MIRHCVMFRWKPETPPATIEAIRAELDQLAEMDAVSEYRHGPDAGLAEGNFDYVVVGEFDDEDAYRSYATDENHLRVVTELIRPNITDRAAVQYAIPDPT